MSYSTEEDLPELLKEIATPIGALCVVFFALVLMQRPFVKRFMRVLAPFLLGGVPMALTLCLVLLGVDLQRMRGHPLAFDPSPATRAALLELGPRALRMAFG